MDARGDVRDNGRRSAPRPCPGAVPRLCEFAVTPTSVDRCIAVAAHGRRCQQTTYRGSPYCWHHTQSRKVWAPSRMGAARPRRAPDAGSLPASEVPILAGEAVLDERAVVTATELARVLSPDQLTALHEFLRDEGDGVFRIDRAGGAITRAELDRRLGRTRAPQGGAR